MIPHRNGKVSLSLLGDVDETVPGDANIVDFVGRAATHAALDGAGILLRIRTGERALVLDELDLKYGDLLIRGRKEGELGVRGLGTATAWRWIAGASTRVAVVHLALAMVRLALAVV